jgi:hypothetical protein
MAPGDESLMVTCTVAKPEASTWTGLSWIASVSCWMTVKSAMAGRSPEAVLLTEAGSKVAPEVEIVPLVAST